VNYALTRSRYLDNAVSTAGPQQVLTMLYDRLVIDLSRAESQQRAGNRAAAADQLDHAQEIVSALASTLQVDVWEGGQSLMDLYMFLLRELMGCSIEGDPDRTAKVRDLVIPLRDAWHQAAASLAAQATPLIPTQRPRPAFGEPVPGGELGVG
jgi:flagellar secretion chaperone FliS